MRNLMPLFEENLSSSIDYRTMGYVTLVKHVLYKTINQFGAFTNFVQIAAWSTTSKLHTLERKTESMLSFVVLPISQTVYTN